MQEEDARADLQGRGWALRAEQVTADFSGIDCPGQSLHWACSPLTSVGSNHPMFQPAPAATGHFLSLLFLVPSMEFLFCSEFPGTLCPIPGGSIKFLFLQSQSLLLILPYSILMPPFHLSLSLLLPSISTSVSFSHLQALGKRPCRFPLLQPNSPSLVMITLACNVILQGPRQTHRPHMGPVSNRFFRKFPTGVGGRETPTILHLLAHTGL